MIGSAESCLEENCRENKKQFALITEELSSEKS